jgi:hypothetical protein
LPLGKSGGFVGAYEAARDKTLQERMLNPLALFP